MAIKQVHVSSNSQGSPIVDIPDVDIWVPDGDQVQWVGTGPYMIDFVGSSPFSSSSFSCPDGSSTPLSSGPIKVGATGSYKYNVKIGSKVLDPNVKVHPP